MAELTPSTRIQPRVLKGFRDLHAADMIARQRMIDTIRRVYESYGFVPLETPALEYVDVLGKYLTETDTPEEGIFAFRDEGDEWVALRYDLTAPLSRVVSLHKDLPMPYRRYQLGAVWRREKPGPGRFREFVQFDFDTVGTASMTADAECCCVMCDTLEALEIPRGSYIVRVNNRKVLNGVLETLAGRARITLTPEMSVQTLRAIDKLDRVGLDGVLELLGPGRKDPSGDVTPGVGFTADQVGVIEEYLSIPTGDRLAVCEQAEALIGDSPAGREGVRELRDIDAALRAADYDTDRVIFDATVVRGLTYYTGPVFEAMLTFEITDEKGRRQQFGSVFGGGRYDDLVERFVGAKVPATGASIGVDRLVAALRALGKLPDAGATASVFIVRLDEALLAEYQRMAQELRAAGLATELYVGDGGLRRQFKYADQSHKTVAVVVGEDEHHAGKISLKDLRLGRELAEQVGDDRRQWLEQQPAQIAVSREQLIPAVRDILARYEA
jgi:histidyl-tRNA synthetase